MKEITELYKDKLIESYSHTDQRGPSMLYVNIDEKCNENCVFCVVKGKNVGTFGSMSKEEVKKTIKDFINNNGIDIVFTGGEPTLRKDLPEIIEYAERFITLKAISIITNGTNLGNDEYIKRILIADKRRLVTFSISLHSHKEDISEQLTGVKGTFKKTIAGIENATKYNFKITIYHVITSNNYKDLFDFVKFLNQNYPKIKLITFAYPFPQGNAINNGWIYVKFSLLKPYFIKTLKYLEKENYSINIASCGQFPLCVIPGFEETVIKSLHWGEQNISGVVGEKSFHEYEMMSPEWVDHFKNKSQKCEKCILDKYCQGFFEKYISLFKFNGLKTITKDNFTGITVISPLCSDNHFQDIISSIYTKKMNLIIIDKLKALYLERLFKHIISNKILAVIISKNNVIYPR